MKQTKLLSFVALLGLALSQQACLTSTLLPAHRLEHTEVVVGGAVELSASSRLSANATVGVGDFMDLSVFGAFGSAFFLIQSYAIGGGVRVYTPIDWALSVQLERDGFLTPLGDTNQVFGLWQSQIRFLSIPNKDFPLYFGPIMTLFTVQAEEVDIGNGLGFVGAMAGINYQINDQLNIQTELLIRPFVFAFAEGAETQALSFFDGEGGQALAQFFGLFQINFGGNFSVHKPSKRIAPSEPPVEPDRRL